MKIWKVIFATLVIFSAGLLAGGLVVKSFQPPVQPVRQTNAVPERWMQRMLLERMKAELSLSPDQKQHIEKIYLPQKSKQTQLLGNGDAKAGAVELAQKLHTEARVF